MSATEGTSTGVDPDLLSIGDVQERSRLGRSFIYEAIAAGRLGSVKIGQRRLVPIEAYRAWLAELTNGEVTSDA